MTGLATPGDDHPAVRLTRLVGRRCQPQGHANTVPCTVGSRALRHPYLERVVYMRAGYDENCKGMYYIGPLQSLSMLLGGRDALSFQSEAELPA
jgi:hypothetical protein